MDSTEAVNATETPRPRGRPPKRSHRLRLLLDRSAELFNLRGISATSVADLADTLQISRASLYYYIEDREDLVFQCYMRACELTEADLAGAAEAASGFERVLAFVRFSLLPSRPTVAVLTEIDVLSGGRAEAVKQANDANIVRLIGFIDGGIADGSVRSYDAEVLAQAINGMLAWAQLLPQWSSGDHMAGLRTRASASDGFPAHDRGFSTDRGRRFECRIDAEQFQRTLDQRLRPPRGHRRSRSTRCWRRLHGSSTAMGSRRPRSRLSPSSLGVTKGVLYHYLAGQSRNW